MTKRLTPYCMQMLSIVQRCAKARTFMSDVDGRSVRRASRLHRSTARTEPNQPLRFRPLCDADGYVVDVTDVPLQYEVEPVKPPKMKREAVAQRVFDTWPRATAVRYSVDTMRKIDEQLIELHVTFDTGFVLHTGPWRMSVARRELDSLLEHGWDECDPELLR